MKPSAYVVFGLGFGDEGKGSIVDFVTRLYGAGAIVRHTGGAQAGHNVTAPDGRWHCFSQFGSGAFNDGVRTYLSREVVIELENLEAEANVLIEKGETDIFRLLTISADCALTTPAHKMSGRLRELARGADARGTCGMGIGEVILERESGNAFTIRDILTPDKGEAKLRRIIQTRVNEARKIVAVIDIPDVRSLFDYFLRRCDPAELAKRYYEILESSGVTVDQDQSLLYGMLSGDQSVVFEGTQGTLIDRWHGFTPYVTKSRATWHNAGSLLESVDSPLPRIKIGVMTASMARHGAGPFVTENESLRPYFNDTRNKQNAWQGKVRIGELDLVALRYSIAANEGVDALVITALDRLTGIGEIRLCTSYVYEGDLDELDPWCEWKQIDTNKAIITALRKVATALEDDRRASVLFACKPFAWTNLPDWSRSITEVKQWYDLPQQARDFVEFLENKLEVRALAVSVNPTATGKILRP